MKCAHFSYCKSKQKKKKRYLSWISPNAECIHLLNF